MTTILPNFPLKKLGTRLCGAGCAQQVNANGWHQVLAGRQGGEGGEYSKKTEKAKAAAAKHKEMKAKAVTANVASKQNIASDFGTHSPTTKGSVLAQQSPKTISRGDLPTFPTCGKVKLIICSA